jgi:hypothetical protein
MKTEILAMSEQNKSSGNDFPVKIGNEIYRLKNRLAKLPKGTKGLEQIHKTAERMKEVLSVEGFEIIELINLKYYEGMTVKVYPSDQPILSDLN